MQIVTNEDSRAAIWERADNEGIQVDRTIDENGEEFSIFQGWEDVEKLAEIIYTILPQSMIDDYAPSWEHLEESRRPNPYHYIEWAIGEYGFSDQFVTCSNCYAAIDTQDYYPMWGYNYDVGEIYCRDCIRADKGDAQGMYIGYCAAHLEDEGEIIRAIAEPHEHGYICLNPYSAYGEYAYDDFLTTYEGIPNFPLDDHPSYDGALSYASHEDNMRLGKSARLVDPNVSVLLQYGRYSTNLIWAKFIEPPSEDAPTNLAILQYTMGLIFAKWRILTNAANRVGSR